LVGWILPEVPPPDSVNTTSLALVHEPGDPVTSGAISTPVANSTYKFVVCVPPEILLFNVICVPETMVVYAVAESHFTAEAFSVLACTSVSYASVDELYEY
jgi:hypothetical protein